ncbi:MAG: hypothetical protein KAQ85_04360 [Thermodesulfovibrionia bacterium]|nr:hypothetical protein [Thermodesulfovibrionia bacterium]
MNNENTIAPVKNESFELFKQGVNDLLSKRSYFISQVLPKLKENQDYYIIKGKKSLAKGGAEKLASIYNLIAIFERDKESLDMLGNKKGLIAFVCTLTQFGIVIGQGRGSDTLERNQNDPNKALKMTQKRAFVDAVIRTTGLSDIFTQDIEDMNTEEINTAPETFDKGKYKEWIDDLTEKSNSPEIQYENTPIRQDSMTDKQRKLLVSLMTEKILDEDEREERLKTVDSLNKYEASDVIKEFIENY